MASPSSTKSDDRILIPKLVNEEAKSPTKLDDESIISELVEEAEKLKRKTEDKKLSNPKAKIQKVQPYLGEREEFAKYYSPKLLSVGPIHHERGKNYKLMWTAMYLEVEDKGTREAAEELLGKIKVKMDKLKGFYSDDVIEGVKDNELAQIFLLDGCAVLHFMDKASIEHPEQLKIKVDQLVAVFYDLLLLENQIPYQLLKLLCNDDEAKLEGYINNFFRMHHMMQPDRVKLAISKKAMEGGGKEAIITVDHPTHLLDLLRTAILRGRTEGVQQEAIKLSVWPLYRNIRELKSARIKVIKTEHGSRLTDIMFSRHQFYLGGKLQLSSLIVDDSTATTFLNLIAYEMCPDFENHYEINSYAAFMGTLIDHPDDVKELREAGVLLNVLGSDEEVAKIFNTIATDLVPNLKIYYSVKQQIEYYYMNKFFIRIAQGYTKHFRSPWSTVGFLTASIALALTCVQTWFAVCPLNRTT